MKNGEELDVLRRFFMILAHYQAEILRSKPAFVHPGGKDIDANSRNPTGKYVDEVVRLDIDRCTTEQDIKRS